MKNKLGMLDGKIEKNQNVIYEMEILQSKLKVRPVVDQTKAGYR